MRAISELKLLQLMLPVMPTETSETQLCKPEEKKILGLFTVFEMIYLNRTNLISFHVDANVMKVYCEFSKSFCFDVSLIECPRRRLE